MHGKMVIPLTLKHGRRKVHASVETDMEYGAFRQHVKSALPHECGSVDMLSFRYETSSSEFAVVTQEEEYVTAIREWLHLSQSGERVPVEGSLRFVLRRFSKANIFGQ